MLQLVLKILFLLGQLHKTLFGLAGLLSLFGQPVLGSVERLLQDLDLMTSVCPFGFQLFCLAVVVFLQLSMLAADLLQGLGDRGDLVFQLGFLLAQIL